MPPLISFHPTRNWEAMWNLTSEECDITRLFDDRHGDTREETRPRFKALIEDTDNFAFEIHYNREIAGYFVLYALGGGTYELHIVLKKNYRGLRGVAIGKEGTKFSLALPHVFQLVSFVPETLKESLYYALSCGWKSIGEIPGKWMKGGKEFKMIGVVARRESCLS